MLKEKKNIRVLSVLFLSVFILLFGFIVNAQTTPPVLTNNSIVGKANYAVAKPYRHLLLIELRRVSDNYLEAIQTTSSGNFTFKNIANGDYKVIVYYYKDLTNANIDPTPMYQTTVSMNTLGVSVPDFTFSLPIKCTKNEMMYYQNGDPSCGAIQTHQPTYNEEYIEEMVRALVNMKMAKTGLATFDQDPMLYESLKSYAGNMALYNYFSLTDLEGCDSICRYNANDNLLTLPYTISTGYYTYDRYYSDTGLPSRYITPFDLAQKISRKVSYGKIKTYDIFDVGVVIQNNKVYANFAGMSNFTELEKQEISSIVSNLTAGESDTKIKIGKIHDWITSNIAYDVKKTRLSHTGSGAFRNRKAVCEGYSDLLRYMLKQAGIHSDIVTGFAPSPHAWNKVTIDDQELYIDSTWDAGYVYRRNFVFAPDHDYFLVPKKCIDVDHAVNKNERVSNKITYINSNLNLFTSQCSGIYSKYIR